MRNDTEMINYAADALIMESIFPVFIVGHPFSGTTLTQLLITGHPTFSSGPETHYFKYVLKPISNWQNNKLSISQLNIVIRRFSEYPGIELDDEITMILRSITKKEKGISAARVLDEVMLKFSKQMKPTATRWIEKTPRHALHILSIMKIYPNAKVINVIRNPIDVVSSTLRTRKFENFSKRMKYCIHRARRWNKEIKAILVESSTNEQIINVYYEDLVSNTLNTIDEIYSFLGEEKTRVGINNFSENYEMLTIPSEHNHKYLASANEIIDRRGIWKTRISYLEAILIILVTLRYFRQFDYLDIKSPKNAGILV